MSEKVELKLTQWKIQSSGVVCSLFAQSITLASHNETPLVTKNKLACIPFSATCLSVIHL